MKAENAIALKEWAVVNRALREGTQLFLLRKGGIAEKDGAFRLEEPEFFIFPTYEHQSADGLAPARVSWIEDAARTKPPAGSLDFDVYARADSVLRLKDRAQLLKLLPFSIWSESFLDKRLAYKPEEPLHVVFARCFRTPHPHRIPDHPDYAGCTSWVTLKQPLAPGKFYPVLSVEVFEERKRKVLEALNA